MSGQTHLLGSNNGNGDSMGPSYLEQLVGEETQHNEYMNSNKMMFWKPPRKPLKDWQLLQKYFRIGDWGSIRSLH